MSSLELLSVMWIMEKKSPLVTPRCEGVTQTVGWEKPDPIHKMAITVGEFTHCHLR
jgi:hypothetical protein